MFLTVPCSRPCVSRITVAITRIHSSSGRDRYEFVHKHCMKSRPKWNIANTFVPSDFVTFLLELSLSPTTEISKLSYTCFAILPPTVSLHHERLCCEPFREVQIDIAPISIIRGHIRSISELPMLQTLLS